MRREADEPDVLARVDDGDRSVRVERTSFVGLDGRPRRLVSVAVYERLHFGGWACRRRVTLRRREIREVIAGLSHAAPESQHG